LILFSSALELEKNKIIIMNNLIVDAARDKIFLTFIVSKNIYTCSHENSKINFEKLMILINEFLNTNKTSLDSVDAIYVNRGPGSFAGIRNSLATIKALFLTKKIDYYCFSFEDFKESETTKYEDVPKLCEKFKVKKNLINPIYLS
jgi:tRNA threonylcarbamoyladenosine biosynthesis protein TsaB